jgi:MraZ protein
VGTFRFQGTNAIALDDKGRLSVPARHREQLQSLSAGQLTLTKHPEGCLMVFPRPTWESVRERIAALPMSANPWKRVFLGSACDVDVDSAQRVLVAPELRAFAGIVKDVVLIGLGGHLELWDAERHAKHEAAVLQQPMPDALQDLVF